MGRSGRCAVLPWFKMATRGTGENEHIQQNLSVLSVVGVRESCKVGKLKAVIKVRHPPVMVKVQPCAIVGPNEGRTYMQEEFLGTELGRSTCRCMDG